jgi:hypothetical protein
MKNRKLELIEIANDLGIKVIEAKNKKDNGRQGIHLLNPDQSRFEDAICVAERDGFETIVLHSNATWHKKAA